MIDCFKDGWGSVFESKLWYDNMIFDFSQKEEEKKRLKKRDMIYIRRT